MNKISKSVFQIGLLSICAGLSSIYESSGMEETKIAYQNINNLLYDSLLKIIVSIPSEVYLFVMRLILILITIKTVLPVLFFVCKYSFITFLKIKEKRSLKKNEQ